MNNFDKLYNKIINEMAEDNNKQPLSQVIKDAIEDEIIENDIQLVDDYEAKLPQVEQYVTEALDGKDYWTIDYGELVNIITDALEDNKLIIH